MTGLVHFHDLSSPTSRFRAEVLDGLRLEQKTLSPKYLYDEVGSALFDAICALPEYYPTRTETALMQTHARAMAARLGGRCALIEFGSGLSRKTQVLISAAAPSVYVPVDIACETLRTAADGLRQLFPDLPVVAICADYSASFALPCLEAYEPSRRAVFFPGSTIGNFEPDEAAAFLARSARLAGDGGALLIGVDLRKDRGTLEAAYDDPQGVTAAFNLNVLARINRDLGADFDLRAFRHRASYSEARGRIDQVVHIGGERIEFRAGETIHTENSYKYSVQEFRALAQRAGYTPRECWVDEGGLFSIHYMEC
jgi:L-histidine N-alpha-methyltransferase